LVRKCHLHPTAEPEIAVAEELRRLGVRARVAHIPHAGITLPVGVGERMCVS